MLKTRLYAQPKQDSIHSSRCTNNNNIKIGKYNISNFCEETLLIDNKLTFESHICRMFHSRSANNYTNRIHERAYDDHVSMLEELLRKDNNVSIHHRNIQILALEMFKITPNRSPQLMKVIFQERSLNYNITSNARFKTKNIWDGNN